MANASQIRANIVDFPSHRVSRPVRDGATFDILRYRMKAGLGRLLNPPGYAGGHQPMEVTDEITKQHVAVSR